jgi:hypothetical protein
MKKQRDLESLKMLSTISLIQVIDGACLNPRELADEICQYPLAMHPIFNEWQGMDSKLSVILIHLSHQYTQDNKVECFRSCDKRTIMLIYQEVYEIYKGACQNARIPFVPNINGLKTILERRKHQKEHLTPKCPAHQ